MNIIKAPPLTSGRLHTLIVFLISFVVSLLVGWFALEDSIDLLRRLSGGYVWISYDWMNLAIPGILISTVTLAILSSVQLIIHRIPAFMAKVSTILFIAGIILAVVGRIGGGKLLNNELSTRSYSPCSAESRTAIFSNTQVWAMHSGFCKGGSDVLKMTLETMRSDIIKLDKEKDDSL